MPLVCHRLEYKTALYISVFKLIKSYTPLYRMYVHELLHISLYFFYKYKENFIKIKFLHTNTHFTETTALNINMLKLAFVFRQLYVEIKFVRTTVIIIVCINKVVHLPKMKKYFIYMCVLNVVWNDMKEKI